MSHDEMVKISAKVPYYYSYLSEPTFSEIVLLRIPKLRMHADTL